MSGFTGSFIQVTINNGGGGTTYPAPVLSVQDITGSEALLVWDAIDRNDLSFFYLDVAIDPDFADLILQEQEIDKDTYNTGGQMQYLVNGLNPDTNYFARVRALYTPSHYSEYSNVIDFATTAAVPTTPMALAPFDVDSQEAKLRFGAAQYAESYELELSSDNFASSETFPLADNGSGSYLIKTRTLSPETAYQYRVKALNSFGSSPDSNIIPLDTFPIVTEIYVPVAIQFQIQSVINTDVHLFWKMAGTEEFTEPVVKLEFERPNDGYAALSSYPQTENDPFDGNGFGNYYSNKLRNYSGFHDIYVRIAENGGWGDTRRHRIGYCELTPDGGNLNANGYPSVTIKIEIAGVVFEHYFDMNQNNSSGYGWDGTYPGGFMVFTGDMMTPVFTAVGNVPVLN